MNGALSDRIFTSSKEGMQHEPDQRHVDLVIQQLGALGSELRIDKSKVTLEIGRLRAQKRHEAICDNVNTQASV